VRAAGRLPPLVVCCLQQNHAANIQEMDMAAAEVLERVAAEILAKKPSGCDLAPRAKSGGLSQVTAELFHVDASVHFTSRATQGAFAE
jgi:hypothetical protein